MAVTYNAWVAPTYIYTDDGGSFSANQAANSVFDYFPDDAVVDDALYFACNANLIRNIKLYIGTSFAATSQTFAWEYWNGSAWTALSDLVNGDALTLSGEQEVTFSISDDWILRAVNGLNRKWIRCRISAIDTPTEGGAQSTQTVEVGNDTILVVSYSEGVPATMTNIYDADVAGSWGVVTKDRNSYTIRAAITWGDGSTPTYFRALDEFIQFYEMAYRYATLNGDDTYVQFGLYNSNYGGYGYRGSGWLFEYFESLISGFRAVGGTIPTMKVYGSRITRRVNSRYTFYSANLYLISVDSYIGSSMHINEVVDIKNSTLYALILSVSPTALIDTRVINTIRFRKSAVLENVSAYDMYMWANYPNTSTVYLKDCTFTTLTLSAMNPDRGVTVYIQEKFDLKVVDQNGDGISGVTVSFSGTESAIGDETTDGSGDITSQWITYRKRVKIGSPAEDTDTYYANPMTVTLTKTGYATRTIKYTMDRKREEIEKLTVDGTNIQDATIIGSTIY